MQNKEVNKSSSACSNPSEIKNAGVDLPPPLPPTDDKKTLLCGKHEMLKRADDFANSVNYTRLTNYFGNIKLAIIAFLLAYR